MLDEPATTTEIHDLARVIRRVLGVLVIYWRQTLPPQHPYLQAARMIDSYIERRYGV